MILIIIKFVVTILVSLVVGALLMVCGLVLLAIGFGAGPVRSGSASCPRLPKGM